MTLAYHISLTKCRSGGECILKEAPNMSFLVKLVIKELIKRTKLKSLSLSYKEIFPWHYYQIKQISAKLLTSKYLPDRMAYCYRS